MNRTTRKHSPKLAKRRKDLHDRLCVEFDGPTTDASDAWFEFAYLHKDDWNDADYVRELAAFMDRLDEKARRLEANEAEAFRRQQAEYDRQAEANERRIRGTTDQPPTIPVQVWQCETGRACASGPYVDGLPAKARKLGGRWMDDDPAHKYWSFPARQGPAVLALWREFHGDAVQVVTELDFDEEPDEESEEELDAALDEDKVDHGPVPDLVTRFNFPFRYEVGGITNVAVLGAIANGMDGKTGVCTYGVKALARMCECDPRTVRRAVTNLERRGLILVERRHRKPNRYRLVTDSDSDSGS